MPGLVISGKQVEVPNVHTLNWFDNPKWRLGVEDRTPRSALTWVRSVYNHVTQGNDNCVGYPDAGDGGATNIEATLDYWAHDGRVAGAHIIINFNGDVYCIADLQTEIAWNSGAPNNKYNIGIEVKQHPSGVIYEAQLNNLHLLVDFITAKFGIQRQVQWPYRGAGIPRLATGTDTVGVFGHRDCSSGAGRGDPSDLVTQMFILGGYELYDFAAYADKTTWKARQAMLNQKYAAGLVVDGVPGSKTVAALKATGLYPDGIWVK